MTTTAMKKDEHFGEENQAIKDAKRTGDAGALAALARDANVHPGNRVWAVRAMSEVPFARARDNLCELLTSPDRDVRITAVRTYSRVAGAAAAPDLERRLAEEEDDAVIYWLARCLGTVARRNAMPTLIDTLARDQWGARAGAAVALATVGDRRTLEPLERARPKETGAERRYVTRMLWRARVRSIVAGATSR